MYVLYSINLNRYDRRWMVWRKGRDKYLHPHFQLKNSVFSNKIITNLDNIDEEGWIVILIMHEIFEKKNIMRWNLNFSHLPI